MHFLNKIMLAVMFVVLGCFNASANVYEVNDIKVEFRKFNAQKIRSYAVDVATKRGLSKLLRDIVPQEYNTTELTHQVDFKKVDVVEKLTIVDEVRKRGKYTATFDIVYKKSQVKRILQAKRIPYTQKSMGNVLILPIEKTSDGNFLLFEETNKLKDLISKNLENNQLIKPIFAKGDFKEVTTYNPQNILDPNKNDKVLTLANSYETSKAITILVEKNNYEGNDLYQVNLTYTNIANMQDIGFVVIGKTLEEVSKQIGQKIISLWQSANLIELNKPKRFVAMINTSGNIDTFNATIKHLKSLNMVSNVEITQATTAYTFVQTDFYGTPNDFLEKAKKDGLNIFKSETGQWTIQKEGF